MRNYGSTGSERGDPGRQKIFFFPENFCWQSQEYLLNGNKMSRDLNAVNPVRKKLWQRRARERKGREKHRAFMLKKDYNYIDKLSDKLPTFESKDPVDEKKNDKNCPRSKALKEETTPIR